MSLTILSVYVKSIDGDSEPDVCLVKCCERSRWVEYPGKLLAIGSKKEMILEVANNRESAQASSEAKKTRLKTGEVQRVQPPQKKRHDVSCSPLLFCS